MTPTTTKDNWLEEVKKDAEFITRKRMREAQEAKEYEASKNQPVTEEAQAEPVEDKKGK